MASSSPTKDARNAVLVKLDIDNLGYLLHSKYSLTFLRVQLVNVLIIWSKFDMFTGLKCQFSVI